MNNYTDMLEDELRGYRMYASSARLMEKGSLTDQLFDFSDTLDKLQHRLDLELKNAPNDAGTILRAKLEVSYLAYRILNKLAGECEAEANSAREELARRQHEIPNPTC